MAQASSFPCPCFTEARNRMPGFPQQIGAKGTELLMNRLADGNADIQNQLALIEPQLKIR